MMPERIWIHTLVGCVLADYIYRGSQCIAVRNQDIGIWLINRFKTFQTRSHCIPEARSVGHDKPQFITSFISTTPTPSTCFKKK